MSRHRLIALLVVAALAGCTSNGTVSPTPSGTGPTSPPTSSTPPDGRPSPSAPQEGGSLRFGLGDDPQSIDPAFVGDDEGLLVVDAIFDSLTDLDEHHRAIPSVARTWEVSEDAMTWTFELDREARFHNGSRVTARDFVRAFDRIADGTATPRSFLAHQLVDIDGWVEAQETGAALRGLTVLEDGRLQIQLRRPNAELPEVLAHPTLGPVPPRAITDPREFADQPMGNGPFEMAEPWAHDQFIRVVRADDAPGTLDEILFRIYADDPGGSQQYADFQARQLHVAQVPASEWAEALATYQPVGDGSDGPGVLDGPRGIVYQVGFDTTRPPFDDPTVRRAVSLLIDRDVIAEEVMLGTRRPATGLVPPGLAGARQGSCQVCRFDPEAARAMLENAGIVLDPEEIGPIRLLHNTGSTHEQIARLVAGAIEEHLGLDVEVEALDLGAFAAAVRDGEAHVFRHGWTSEHGTAGSMLPPLFDSRSIGRDNVFRFADETVDAAFDRARATLERGDRLRAWFEAEDRLLELMPAIPVLSYELGLVVADDVIGFRMDALGRVDLTDVALGAEP